MKNTGCEDGKIKEAMCFESVDAVQNKQEGSNRMEQKVYKVMKGAGAANIAVGVTTLIVGIVSGILLIITGAKLIVGKSKILF